jgi:hypothetical protein
MMERREGITIGQPPKYVGYEDDLYRVLEVVEPVRSGGLDYLCECKLCGGKHKRTSHQLKKQSRARECPEYRSPNWSGYDREDAIIQRMYGITMAEFDKLVEFQKGNCAVCFKPLEILNRRANIDHDHETGEVRGILCTGCNTGIGHLGDNIEGLERALYYLKHTPYAELKETE